MSQFPWEEEIVSDGTHLNNASRPCQLSVSEVAALGFPVDDSFWIMPEAFDAYLAGLEAEHITIEAIGPNAPAAQPMRIALPNRAPLPSLNPRKKAPGKEELPPTVERAIVTIATPHAPDRQAVGAAAYLLKWYQVEFQRRPTVDAMVLWWWKAARCLVHVPNIWADEFKVLWNRPDLDPSEVSVNAFFGHVSRHASRLFKIAQGHPPEDTTAHKISRHARTR